MKTVCIAMVLIVLMSGAQGLPAQVPGTISYQGSLTDSYGEAAEDGTYVMQFKLYENSDSETELWYETQDVEVAGGIFSVILGSVSPFELPFDTQYYLGISIDNGEELEPRIPFNSVPYALQALSVPDGSIGTSKLADEAVTYQKLADEAVTNQKLADGSVTPGKIVSIPAASATSVDNLTVNNNAPFTVPLNATFFDTANIHNQQINNTRLTAPIDGIYQVSATVTWSANNNGTRSLSVRQNNIARISDVRSADGFMSQNLSGLLQLNGGEYIELGVFQDSGVTLELSGSAPLRFEMVWVGPAN